MKKLKSIVSLALAFTVTTNYLSVIGAAGAEENAPPPNIRMRYLLRMSSQAFL